MGKAVIRYYKQGRYTDEDMKIFVMVNWITKEQYEELTGIKYVE